jgi:gliding motility-associated-like protein
MKKNPLLIGTSLKLYGFMLTLFLLIAGVSNAQVSVPCPQNIDFSFGNFNNWKCYTGSVTAGPSSTGPPTYAPWTLSGPVGGTAPCGGTSRHALTTGTGTDCYGGFPEVAPGGGLFSVRVGNDQIGAEAEMIQYYIHVPPGFNNYSFNFKYAVVFEDPGHGFNEQPRFTVQAFDSATGNVILCASQTFVAGQVYAQAFQRSSVGTQPFYLPWTTGNLNLSGSGGKTIIVEVRSTDCTASGHFGYGYFDVISCGQFNAAITYCNLKSGILTLAGPPGYQKYEWWNQTFTTRLNSAPYNNQTINVPAPVNCQYYNLVITPYNQNGCPDTIRTKVLCDFAVNATPDSACNTLGKPIQLNTAVTGGLGGFTYAWTGDTTLSAYNIPGPIASPVSSGYYVVTVTDSNGCFRQDTVKIENPGFKINLGPDDTTCLGTPINLNPSITPVGAPGYVFTWTPATGLSNTTIINPTFTPFATGTQRYILRVDSGICATADTMNIYTLPNTFNTTDAAVCEGEQMTPQVSGDPNFRYTWTWTGPQPPFNQNVLDFPTPPTKGSDQTPTFKADTTRTFTITARFHSCPDIVKQLNVRVEPIPIVSLGDDTVFKCLYAPIYLTTNVGPSWFSNYAYQWRADDYIDKPTSPIITFTGNVDTTLRVTVRTPLGCFARDSVRIHVFPGKFGTLSPIDPEMCPRNAVTLSAGGGVKYRWSPDLYLSNANAPVVSSIPVTTTEYTVYVSDKNGCVDTLKTTVTVHPEGTVSLPDTIVLYPGESYELNPHGNLLYYSWFPTVGLSPNASVSNPVASPTVNTRYYVTGTTEAGCKASDSIYVLVREESAIGMANAFSPGSEPNPEFKVSHLGTATLKSFRIYNRWGVKVFETSDINKGWDGTYSGTPQPMGVYIYTVEAQSNSGKPFVKQGNVTLLR